LLAPFAARRFRLRESAVVITQKHRLIMYVCTALLAACGGGSGEAPSSATQSPPTSPAQGRPVTLTDQQIATALYNDNARTPQGFYSDISAPTTGYVATVHVKSRDVFNNNALPQYELCSDDWNEAYTWAEQAAQNGTSNGNLLETNTTTNFYEFVRERTTQPSGVTRSRVYRCAYLDRGGVNLSDANATHAGQFNLRPITSTSIRELAEYLWRFTQFNNYGSAVLKSATSTATDELQQDLTIASLTLQGAAGGCDRIDIYSWTHTVDAQSGELTLTASRLWNFASRRIGNLAELCN
jgi:hypothetical protein